MSIRNRYTVEVFHTICTEYEVIAESEQEARESWQEHGVATGYVSDANFASAGDIIVHYEGEVTTNYQPSQ